MKIASIVALLLAPLSLALGVQEQLDKLAADGNGIIYLNAATFDLLTAPQRTWTASVHFTALAPQRRCHPCKQFDPAWRAVAKAWSQVPSQQRHQHYFATIDFDDAPAVFQKLELFSAPVVFNYPAASGDRKPANGKTTPIKYDFNDGFDAGPLASVISRITPIPIPYKDPFDWTRLALTAIGLLSTVLFIHFMSPLVRNKWTWSVITFIVMLIMTSGFMFVHIRGAPYAGPNGQWIAGGYQNQYGQEVHVISFIYGLLSFAFIMIIQVVPHQSSPSRQRLQVLIWTGVITVLYSVLISLFRVKNSGYPFKLFL